MRLIVDLEGRVTAHETDVLTSLDVLAPDRNRLPEAFAGIGTVDRDHVWVDIAWLKQTCSNPSEQWQTGFDAMIGYATSKGWTHQDRLVRAHISTI